MLADERRSARGGNLIGSVVADRYHIRGVIGSGAMSTVFVAWHLRLRCHVAVKVLDPTLADEDEAVERFEREARSLARLDHPNCLRVLDYGVTDENLHFMVTELVRGVELRDLMAGRVEASVALRRMQQILAGLEHAHLCGVIHRDLKPENILVIQGPDGEESLKIVDFGIAKVVGALPGSGLTSVDVIYGTPHYMSPEQAQGRTIDYRSDLYAAGVLLYTMLAGEHPFDHVDPMVVVDRQIHGSPPPLPASIPASLAAITMRLLAKDPSQRYASAAEASEAIGAARARLEASTAPKPSRAAARRRWRTAAWIVAAGVAVIAVSLLGSSLCELEPSVAEAASTPQPRAEAPRPGTRKTAS